jgi:hypothetical protein
MQKERFVDRISETVVTTQFGEFKLLAYDDRVSRAVHLVLVRGDLSASNDPLVRVHLQDTLGDVLGVQSPKLGWPLISAIERVSREKAGAVVILREQETSRDLMEAVENLHLTFNNAVVAKPFSEPMELAHRYCVILAYSECEYCQRRNTCMVSPDSDWKLRNTSRVKLEWTRSRQQKALYPRAIAASQLLLRDSTNLLFRR